MMHFRDNVYTTKLNTCWMNLLSTRVTTVYSISDTFLVHSSLHNNYRSVEWEKYFSLIKLYLSWEWKSYNYEQKLILNSLRWYKWWKLMMKKNKKINEWITLFDKIHKLIRWYVEVLGNFGVESQILEISSNFNCFPFCIYEWNFTEGTSYSFLSSVARLKTFQGGPTLTKFFSFSIGLPKYAKHKYLKNLQMREKCSERQNIESE